MILFKYNVLNTLWYGILSYLILSVNYTLN